MVRNAVSACTAAASEPIAATRTVADIRILRIMMRIEDSPTPQGSPAAGSPYLRTTIYLILDFQLALVRLHDVVIGHQPEAHFHSRLTGSELEVENVFELVGCFRVG